MQGSSDCSVKLIPVWPAEQSERVKLSLRKSRSLIYKFYLSKTSTVTFSTRMERMTLLLVLNLISSLLFVPELMPLFKF